MSGQRLQPHGAGSLNGAVADGWSGSPGTGGGPGGPPVRHASGMNRKVTLEELWKGLKPGLLSVFHLKGMNRAAYMLHYSHVYGYCISIPAATDENDASAGPGPAHPTVSLNSRAPTKKPKANSSASPSTQASWVGMELYKKLRDYIVDHLHGVLTQIKGYHGDSLLGVYCAKWKDFRFSSQVCNGICDYLNRHWVKRENDEGRNKDVYTIYGMCLVQWREYVFTPIEQQLSRAVLDLINADRNGESINSQLLREIIDNFVELGVTSDAQEEANRKGEKEARRAGLEVYSSAFEGHFLEETAAYYVQESATFLRNNSVNDYIKKVQSRLIEEEERSVNYLHESTAPALKKVLEDVLIIRHTEAFHAEFIVLLTQDKIDELAAMYSLISRVPSLVEELHRLVETHIKSHGAAAVARNVDQLVGDPRAFVLTILDVYYRSLKLIQGAFKSDLGFSIAMDRAFSTLVNNNEVTAAAKSSSKVPELLARYCDALLKKSQKNPDDAELDESLNRVMIIFRYVDEKDVFQKFYGKMLAKRLVTGLSASDDFEAAMISKLKAVCGFEYTSKLQRMFQDMGLSKDLNEQFKQYLERHTPAGTATGSGTEAPPLLSSKDLEFTVQILSTGAWPFSERTALTLPTELERPVTVFREFYHGKYSGRKLTWLYNMSRCELSANCFRNRYILQVSTYQAAVLLLFNDTDACSLGQMAQLVNCEAALLAQILVALVKSRILTTDDSPTAPRASVSEEPGLGEAAGAGAGAEVEEKDLEPGTVLRLNLGFKSKKLKINLNMPIRAEQKQEEENTARVIEEDRKLLIQASVVRIMKMRKSLKHQQLIGETLAMLASRFKPTVPLIKKCIEILIQKEYMKRDEENRDLYNYIA
ncbi:cullin-1-like [Paramacrobiotus metropolitanus]|uniref:cullin-1-like n=1 Tax=Paramacrobiotus metropolitanus TaxID=2943436 RepID=UPI002446115B|nr:cullin-1-like [Paramacrobiotus metropolitanus]XP_055342514.1 cullin-1-like [Paramacrobiotus metropolitanus]XP_055342515.1 cullin-1-like [Paramacrobiotus metropolitanus]XP_055342516.1 cullin-1-like [Paramacrobiotus metropolitanus]